MQYMALKVAGTIFLLVAIMHLSRVLFKVRVTIGGFELPLWVSGIGLIATFSLSVWMFWSIGSK